MNGAFNGFGIPQDLKTEDSTIKNDPYLLKLREILSQENIMNEYTQERTSSLQQELLYPYLNFFLRNDKNDYYKKLFFSRGLTEDENGSLKEGLVLSDLIKLRIHSDDLRGDGQEIRRIEHFPDKSYGMNFMSSGTTKGTNGPVNLYRSNISLDLSRKTNGNLIDWSLGKKIDGGECLFHMAPEMTNFLAFAAIGSDFLRDRGLKVGFGAKIKNGPKDSTIWQRIGPNIKEMRKFFKSKNHTKYFIASGVGLYKMFMEPKGIKGLMMKLSLGAPPVYLGKHGVLMIGGGLKRLPPEITSLSQVVKSTSNKIYLEKNSKGTPAPVIDMLGLTESGNVFIGLPNDPNSEESWAKYPHPLSYTALLNSPNDLTPVKNPKAGKEYLLFYVNFATLDYIEAIIPGDFVLPANDTPTITTIMGERNISQRGFIYSRRAEVDEGFKIREGCG